MKHIKGETMWNDVKISAVISAYNEENTVAAVVETALKSNIIVGVHSIVL